MVTGELLPSCTCATGLVPSDVANERSEILAPSSHTSSIDPVPATSAWICSSCHTPLLIFVALVVAVPDDVVPDRQRSAGGRPEGSDATATRPEQSEEPHRSARG